MNKCEKCGYLHYRTDPCRKPKERVTSASEASPLKFDKKAWMREYMRDYMRKRRALK